jgi:two-component system, NarL family, nitrate/nitrite response regulator NarL
MRGARSSLRQNIASQVPAAKDRAPNPGESAGRVRVLLVADVHVHRELLSDALGSDGCIEVAGSSPSSIASLAIRMTEPTVILVDVSTHSDPAWMLALAAVANGAKIVAFGAPEDESTLLELIQEGVAGYVTAEQPLADVVEAVEAAAKGELRCSPRVSAALAERLAALRVGAPALTGEQRLTRREREIAGLIVDGLSNKQIAGRLSIERATVKNHVHNILAKLGVGHRNEVAALVRSSILMLLSCTATGILWAFWID